MATGGSDCPCAVEFRVGVLVLFPLALAFPLIILPRFRSPAVCKGFADFGDTESGNCHIF